MSDVHGVSIWAEPLAWPASSWVSVQASGDACRDVGRASSAAAPRAPVSVIGTSRAVSRPVSPDRRVLVAVPAGTAVGRLTRPAVPVVDSPVCARRPAGLLVWMTGDRPGAAPRRAPVTTARHAACADDVRSVLGPAHHPGMPRSPHRCLRRVRRAVPRLPEVLALSVARGRAGLEARVDARHAAPAGLPGRGFADRVVSEGNAAAGNPWRPGWAAHRRRDPGRAGRPCDSALVQPRGGDVLTGLDDLEPCVPERDSIGVAPHRGGVNAPASAAWPRRAEACLEAGSRPGREPRGAIAPWPGTCGWGNALAVIEPPGGEPRLQWSADAWAGVARRPSGGRVDPSDAGGPVGREDRWGVRAKGRDQGVDRRVTGAARAPSRAGGGPTRGPCRRARGCAHGLAGTVCPHGEAEGPVRDRVGLRAPDPADRRGCLPTPPGVDPCASWGGRQGCAPVDPRGLLAVRRVGHLPSGSSPCRPSWPPEVLALAHGSDRPTPRGAVEARLTREHGPRSALPGPSGPSLPRCRGLRGHGVGAALRSSPGHGVVSPSASPGAFPWALACATSPCPTSLRLTPAPGWSAHGECRRSWGPVAVAVRVSRGAGIRWGGHLAHAKHGPA